MIANQLREARLAENLNVMQLSKKTGVARTQILHIESGGNPTLDTVRRIAAALPSLRVINLGGTLVLPRGLAADVVLDTARSAIATARAAIDELQGMIAVLEAALQSASTNEVSPERAQELDAMVDEVKRQRSDS